MSCSVLVIRLTNSPRSWWLLSCHASRREPARINALVLSHTCSQHSRDPPVTHRWVMRVSIAFMLRADSSSCRKASFCWVRRLLPSQGHSAFQDMSFTVHLCKFAMSILLLAPIQHMHMLFGCLSYLPARLTARCLKCLCWAQRGVLCML